MELHRMIWISDLKLNLFRGVFWTLEGVFLPFTSSFDMRPRTHILLQFLVTSAVSLAASSPQVCLIIRVYSAHEFSLPPLLASVFAGSDTRSHMRAVVVDTDDNAPFPGLKTLVGMMNTLIGFPGILVSPRRTAEVKLAFPKLTAPEYGYLTTVSCRVQPVVGVTLYSRGANVALHVSLRTLHWRTCFLLGQQHDGLHPVHVAWLRLKTAFHPV
jgi:hypothetical protein